MDSDKIREINDALGICCGETDIIRKHIHKTLKILAMRTGNEESWSRSVALLTAHFHRDQSVESHAMFYVYLHFLDKMDLIEHGCGIAGSWLTKHGEEMLAALDCIEEV